MEVVYMGIFSNFWNDSRTEREFVESGYKCCTRTNDMGHRCGYVMVPLEHPADGMSYDKAHESFDIDVDGGLTFSRSFEAGTVFGWDAAHAWHLKDVSIMSDDFKEFYDAHPERRHESRYGYMVDADMAERETRRLARQMREIADGERRVRH